MNAEERLRHFELLRDLILVALLLVATLRPAWSDAAPQFGLRTEATKAGSRFAANWLEICRRRGGESCEEALIQFKAAYPWKRAEAGLSLVGSLRTVPSLNIEPFDRYIRPRSLAYDGPAIDTVPSWNIETFHQFIYPHPLSPHHPN
jgi:hypothetical protein